MTKVARAPENLAAELGDDSSADASRRERRVNGERKLPRNSRALVDDILADDPSGRGECDDSPGVESRRDSLNTQGSSSLYVEEAFYGRAPAACCQ